MIYLDYVSTTPLDKEVNQMYQSLLNDYFANADSLYSLGLQTSSLMEKSRSLIADMLDVKPTEIFFTSGATFKCIQCLYSVKRCFWISGRFYFCGSKWTVKFR